MSLRRVIENKQLKSWEKNKTGTLVTLAESLKKLHLMAVFKKLYILAENSVVYIIPLMVLNCAGGKEEEYMEIDI